MRALKRTSDALAVLAIVFLVIAVVGPSWAYLAAAVSLLGAVLTTSAKRRRSKARRAQT